MKKVCVLVLCALCLSSYAEKISDIQFAKVGNKKLLLDLYLPERSDAKTPLLMWIHGGGWVGGSKKNASLSWLSKHGIAVASISYRFSQEAIFPAQIHDCKGALRWLRANAAKYNIDESKVAVAGSSAGGMLAALIGTSAGDKFVEGTVGGNTDQSTKVSAVIDFYGATDFILRSKTQPHRANKEGSVVYKLLGGGADKKVELAKKASAVNYLTKEDPPFLIIHGDKDKTVLIDQSERIHAAYQKAGLDSTFIVIKNGGHGGKKFHTDENNKLMLTFLKKHLF
ncbi:MAG: alpha/beta hydrolase [Lentisphaeraceae bacterium]|nr:alpha/beta hydrolase [Lentisphaeraceae bacterium]